MICRSTRSFLGGSTNFVILLLPFRMVSLSCFGRLIVHSLVKQMSNLWSFRHLRLQYKVAERRESLSLSLSLSFLSICTYFFLCFSAFLFFSFFLPPSLPLPLPLPLPLFSPSSPPLLPLSSPLLSSPLLAPRPSPPLSSPLPSLEGGIPCSGANNNVK